MPSSGSGVQPATPTAGPGAGPAVQARPERGSSRRRVVARGALLTTSLPLLAACGGAGSAEPVRRERAAPYTVRFMALDSHPWMLEQFDRYNREVGPAQRILLAPEPQPGQAALFAKFQSSVAAGDAPDVARLKEIWVFEMFLKGVMLKLDPYFKSDKEFNAADLLPLYQDNFKFRGEYYAVAREVSIIVGYYNKAHFADTGLDPNKTPSTYEEVREYARKLTRPGPTAEDTRWGLDVYEYGTREFLLLWLLMHVRRWGGEFWNRDKTGVALNSPQWLETYTYFVDLITKDRSARPATGPNTVGTWRSTGKISIWDQGTWDIAQLPRNVPDLNFGVFLWPKKVNQQHIPTSGSSAITKASKDPEATWEFVKWWNTPENQTGWYLNAGGNAPSRKSLYGRPPFSDNPVWKPLVQFITESAGSPRPMSDRYTEFAESMTPALMTGLTGQASPRDALEEATRIGNAFWREIGGNASKAL